MSVYLVTWDINQEGLAYDKARDPLMEAIDTYEPDDVKYDPLLDSVRFISTDETADELYSYLKVAGRLDTNDRLVVSKIERGANNCEGDLRKDLWTWINERV